MTVRAVLVMALFGVILIGTLLLGGLKPRVKDSGTYGGGEPCYYPTTRQADDSCK